MKKKYIFLNIITVLFPIIFSGLIPIFILDKLDRIAQMKCLCYRKLIYTPLSLHSMEVQAHQH